MPLLPHNKTESSLAVLVALWLAQFGSIMTAKAVWCTVGSGISKLPLNVTGTIHTRNRAEWQQKKSFSGAITGAVHELQWVDDRAMYPGKMWPTFVTHDRSNRQELASSSTHEPVLDGDNPCIIQLTSVR